MKARSLRVGEIRVFQKSCVQTQKRSEIITGGNRLWSGWRRRENIAFFLPSKVTVTETYIFSVFYPLIIASPLTSPPLDFIRPKKSYWGGGMIRAQKSSSNFMRRNLQHLYRFFRALRGLWKSVQRLSP